MRREFYLQDDRSNKFWTIQVSGVDVVTTNGRIGAKPRETRTSFATAGAAESAAEKEVLAKRHKGYIEGDLADVPAYSTSLPPRFVRINHDDYHAKYVGKTPGGTQFFLTHPFAPTMGGDPGGQFIALYTFDEFGLLLEASIDSVAGRTQTEVDAMTHERLERLGKYRFGNIKVAPFSVERFGRTFGLVFDPDDEEELGAWVNALPGDYMAFFPPWDGEYDT